MDKEETNKKEIDKPIDDLKELKIKLKKTLESNDVLRKLKDDLTEQIEGLMHDNERLITSLYMYKQSKREVEDLKENIVRLKEILSAIGIIYETYKK